ncbi:MAG: EamA family transporter [Lentisphaeria bacterium]|nr:EamA family transporter [Lentisphaeria bacterium]
MSGDGSGRSGILLVLTAGVSWGLLGIFVRGLAELGLRAADIASLRSCGAALVLCAVFAVIRPKAYAVKLRHLWCMAGCGILSITCFNICYFEVLRGTTVNIAVVLLYTSPAFVMVMAALFFGERLTLRRIAALAAVLAGCILVSGVFSSGGALSPRVLLWGLGSGFCYALYTIFGRCAQNRGYDSCAITLWTFIFSGGSGIFLPNRRDIFEAASGGGPRFWGLLAGLVLIATILPYCAYTAGLKRLTPSTSAITAAVEPLAGTLVGVLVFHEKLTAGAAAGMILILGAVFLCREKNG